jgi:hypothetical protein
LSWLQVELTVDTKFKYTPQCLAAKNAGVIAFIPGGAPADIEDAAASCSQQGWHPVYLQSVLLGRP